MKVIKAKKISLVMLFASLSFQITGCGSNLVKNNKNKFIEKSENNLEPEEKLLKFSRNGDAKGIQQALKSGARLNARNNIGDSALIIASKNNNYDAILLLLDEGAEVNAKNPRGFTPLMAASSEGDVQTIKVLIRNGAKVNATDSSGWTALMWATRYNQVSVVKSLINAGAILNIQGDGGETPLILAIKEGSKEKIKYFIENGAILKGQKYCLPIKNSKKVISLKDLRELYESAGLIKKESWDMIENGQFGIGMTECALLATMGKPDSINKTVTPRVIHKQYVYGNTYIYVENGKVSSYQTKEYK